MGFVFTVAYIALALLSPVDLFPSLASYRIELIIVALAVLWSVPSLLEDRFFRIPQVYLVMGLAIAIFLSVALTEHWIGGGLYALQRFMSAAIVFYLIVLNCQTTRHLQILVSVLVLVGVLYVLQGAKAYLSADTTSPLLKLIPIAGGGYTFRMQGLGFLRDPNELAQFLVTLLPFIWIRWLRGAHIRNVFVVLAPTALFVWGIYLTHSRGGVLALVVIIVLGLKDRVNPVFAAAAGGMSLVAMVALDFGGGREISAQAGTDRFDLWGDGLRLFLESPLYGIGFERFAGSNHGHTAHNSFVVCLAELGILGYAFWAALLVFTVSGLNSLIRSLATKVSRAYADTRSAYEDGNEESDQEAVVVDKWAKAVRLALAGFLAAAFFLSRAYVLPLYLTLGMAVAVLLVSSDDEQPIARKSLSRLLALSAQMALAVIAFIYVTLRLRSLIL